jgi:hypothetical protein
VKTDLANDIVLDVVEKWKPVFDQAKNDDELGDLYAAVTASMHAKWKVSELVEIWTKHGATLGMITHREYRTTLIAFVYTILADGELYERRDNQIFAIGEAKAPFIVPPMKILMQRPIAQEILSVQPAPLPKANIFYLDYTYGEDNNESAQPTNPDAECPERSIPALQEEEQGLWGRIRGLWARWCSSSSG